VESGTHSAGTTAKTPPIEARNPLSLRLFKVLGARYDDPSTREAIEILSSLYAPAPSTATGTTRPRRNTVRSRADGNISDDTDEERPPALPLISGTVDKDTASEEVAARARKNLRKDMEDKLAQSSRMFLAAFSEVNQVGRSRFGAARIAILMRVCDRIWISYSSK
jgi:conserved oligomeric Golgi complex subunit 6